MSDIYRAAAEVERFCLESGWRFCFIGGLAVQRWADPRQTEDADLTLLTGFSGEEKFVDALLGKFTARAPGERERALRRRVLLLYSSNGIEIDIALGGLPFEERSVVRASRWRIDQDISLTTCSAEDLIVHKAFAARDLDWADVASIISRQGRRLNMEQVWGELRPLVELKEEPAILEKLQRTVDQSLG